MSFFSVVAPLVLAGGAFANPLANPLVARGNDACGAAVTGKAALSDDSLRASHCKSYLNVVVTPAPSVVTVTLTGDVPDATAEAEWEAWEDAVTVCPNQVPDYASACDAEAYKTACGAYGKETTTTVAIATTTKTVVVTGTCAVGGEGGKTTSKGGSGSSTTTKSGTSTTSGGFPFPTGKCLDQDKVDYFIESFTDFLENTNAQGGNGFNTDLAKKVLVPDFKDYSDSINYMTKFSPNPIPLGGVTFPNRDAFIGAQGAQPQATVTTLHTWYNCKTISWNWSLLPQLPASIFPHILPVKGISVLEISDDLSQIVTNYAEFNNGAWLYGLNLPECQSSNSTKRALPAF